jgi:hypothetical protein
MDARWFEYQLSGRAGELSQHLEKKFLAIVFVPVVANGQAKIYVKPGK